MKIFQQNAVALWQRSCATGETWTYLDNQEQTVNTILIAEDSADDYRILEHAFGRAEFEADKRRARDGVEAKAYLAGDGPFADRDANPLPALIICDIKMPRMNGLELLRWTRQRPFIRRIPFIMLTASGVSADICAAYDSFVTSYHIKPNRLKEMIEMLKQVREYWFTASVRADVPDVRQRSGQEGEHYGS